MALVEEGYVVYAGCTTATGYQVCVYLLLFDFDTSG